jgi:hypothetical protein
MISAALHRVRPKPNRPCSSPDFEVLYVPDLSAQEFELLGARRDVIDAQTAAVLVYRRRKHIISVFIRPLTSAIGTLPTQELAA